MQISSQNDTQSILSIARQSALGKSSKDKSGGEGEGFQAALATGGVSYSQGYSSFQDSLATMGVDNADTAATTTTTRTLTGAEEIAAGGGGLMSDALTQSDWDLIQKTTGLTPANDKTGNWLDAEGNTVSSGSAYEQAGAMVFGMADMRIYAATFGTSGDMFSGTGDITPEQLETYFAKYQSSAASGSGPFSSTVISDLEKALST